MNRSELYFHFFKCVQAIENILDEVEQKEERGRWSKVLKLFRTKLDESIEETIRLSAFYDWGYAYRVSGFKPFYEDFDDFARRNWSHLFA